MTDHSIVLIVALVALGSVALIAGVLLAFAGYSSAGPFAVASAVVGVLGAWAVEERHRDGS